MLFIWFCRAIRNKSSSLRRQQCKTIQFMKYFPRTLALQSASVSLSMARISVCVWVSVCVHGECQVGNYTYSSYAIRVPGLGQDLLSAWRLTKVAPDFGPLPWNISPLSSQQFNKQTSTMATLLGAFSGQTKWNCWAHRHFLLCVSCSRSIMPIQWAKVLSAHNFHGAIKSIQLLSTSRRMPLNEILLDQIAWGCIDSLNPPHPNMDMNMNGEVLRIQFNASPLDDLMGSALFLLGIPMMGGKMLKSEISLDKETTHVHICTYMWKIEGIKEPYNIKTKLLPQI